MDTTLVMVTLLSMGMAAALSVIVGSDKLLQLFDPRWYENRDAVIATLLDRAHVRYGLRAGDEEAVRCCQRVSGSLSGLHTPG